jgi:hypothetical protein
MLFCAVIRALQGQMCTYNHDHMKIFLRVTALVLLFFNGVSALFGGMGLMSDPGGEAMQMPLEFLNNTPFQDFLIPGIILFTFNGVFSIVIAVLTILKVKSYPWMVIFEGCVLILWLTVQVIMIKKFYPPLHVPYYLTGILLVITGFLLIRD